ncbi:MAG: energy transducer TonB [FCB group bacterium]|nr:energy transducer TonB [FCB group bacterium]
MYKSLLFNILALVVLVGCGPKNQPPEEIGGNSVKAGPINSPDPGRSPDPKPKFGQEIPPEPTHQEAPVYPNQARELGITGCVTIHAFIDLSGRVKEASTLNCDRPGFGFEEAALKAAYKFRYKPAIQNGTAIGVWISYKVNFKLY